MHSTNWTSTLGGGEWPSDSDVYFKPAFVSSVGGESDIVSQVAGIFLNPNQRTLFFQTPSHKQAGSQASAEQEKRQRLRNSRSNRCCQKTMVTAVAIDIVPHDLTGVVDSYGIRA